MEENRNTGPIIIIILTIALALAGWMWKTGRLNLNFFNQAGSPVQSAPVETIEGGVAEGFPMELILTSDARIQGSSVHRIESMKQTLTVVSYFTEATMPDVFAGYLSYFADNNYNVFLSTAKQTSASIVAKGKYAVGVTLEILDAKNLRVEVNVTKNDPR